MASLCLFSCSQMGMKHFCTSWVLGGIGVTQSKIKLEPSWALVAHACNPSFSGGGDQENCSSRAALAKS
jgi:hypothetical protein